MFLVTCFRRERNMFRENQNLLKTFSGKVQNRSFGTKGSGIETLKMFSGKNLVCFRFRKTKRNFLKTCSGKTCLKHVSRKCSGGYIFINFFRKNKIVLKQENKCF